MNRRKFIKATAGALAGSLMLPLTGFTNFSKPIAILKPYTDWEEIDFYLKSRNYKLQAKFDNERWYLPRLPWTDDDTRQFIVVRKYSDKFWGIRDPRGNWRTMHKSWVKNVLHKLIYAQRLDYDYVNTTYNGRNYVHTFKRPDGSLLKIKDQRGKNRILKVSRRRNK